MPSSVAVTSLYRWLHTSVGKTLVQGLIFILVFHGWPLQELSRVAWWRRTPLTQIHQKGEELSGRAGSHRQALSDPPDLALAPLLTLAPEPAYADTVSCPVCDGATVVVDTAIELDATNLPGTAGVLAPFASFDGETITIDSGTRALQVTSTGRISVLAGSTRHPAQFHQSGNHGTPNLLITSACTLQIDESTRGTTNSKFRNLTGVIETNALGGRAGDIHLAFAGPIIIHGGVQSFQENLPDAQASLSGALMIESTCGDLLIGPSAWLVTWGQNPGSGPIDLLQTRGGDIVIDGVVMNRTNHTIGDNDPPIINVVARAGGVTINGGHLVLDEWTLMGTKYDVTSGLVVISREAADVGRIAIQATGDVSIARDVSGLNLNRQNFAAVATVVNSSGPIGGEVQIRSLTGSIEVRDRAVQADGKGVNGTAVIELVADRDIVLESPTVGGDQHRPTLTTAATAVNGVGQGGTNSLQACDGVVVVAAGAEVLATGLSAPGINQITADEVSLLGVVNPPPVLGPGCDDPEPLFPEGLDQTPPTLSITAPSEAVVLNDETPEVRVAYADDDVGVDLGSLRVLVDGLDIGTTCTVGAAVATCESPVLAEGQHTVEASIRDLAGNLATASQSFALLLNAECLPGTTATCYEGPPETLNVGPCGSGTQTCQADGTFGPCQGQVLPELEIPDNGLDDDCDGVDLQGEPLPPDPSTVAPPADRTVATTVFDATAFLYTGPDPIQTGVAPGTIEPQRAAVIRGQVTDRAGAPMPGVSVAVLNHPELGQTLTRADGRFDLVVNGGGPLTLHYEKPGTFPAQRQVQVPWQDYTFADEVVLIPPDPQVTPVELSDPSTPMQIAQGSIQTDTSGTRQATLLFPQGTQAEMVLPDGSVQPLTTLHVRATEYTVGENGPEAMPAQLPPTSQYTYAVELSADEALTAGATAVRFNQPIPFYVENFLDFPVGGAVPLGAYDLEQGVWVPEQNGQVIEVLSITGGVADLDTNGDGIADDAATLSTLGITTAEQEQLATLYTPGRSLWRMTLTFFSRWDCNWPGGPPADAIVPNGPNVGEGGDDGDSRTLDDADSTDGTGIEYQNQVKGEQVDLSGTPFSLHYRSDRTRGRSAAYTVTIPLSGNTLPASVQRIDVTIQVAGRQITQSFAPQPNLVTTFTWDGRDAYGRLLQGRHPVSVAVEFVYDAVYQQPAASAQAFAQLSGVPLPLGSRSRGEFLTGRQWEGELGTWDAREQGLGGWSLDMQHGYDPIGQTLYSGDGSRRSSQSESSNSLNAAAATVAGTGTSGSTGDGGPAGSARLNSPQGVAVDAQGNR